MYVAGFASFSGRRKRSVVLLPKSKDGSKSESSLPNMKAEDGMELNSERLGANVPHGLSDSGVVIPVHRLY